MLEKGKGQAVLDALDEKWERRERYFKEKSLLERVNPLTLIDVGTPSEVREARKLAKEIVLPMKFSSEVEEDCVQLIAFAFLHLMYLHGADKRMLFPTMDIVVSFLQGAIVEEEEMDEDGYPIEKSYHAKSFWHVVCSVCNAQYFDLDEMLVLKRYSFDEKTIHHDNIKEIYCGYTDVVEFNAKVHPWIYKVALALSCRDKKVVNERAYLASLALQQYIDEHGNCRLGSIDNEIRRRFDLFGLESYDGFDK